jgi:uncharacterized protein (DUF433 family)
VWERISIDSKVHFGKPFITGTRITVENILELLSEGVSSEQICKDYYPDVTAEDIQACLQYAKALVAAEEIDLHSVTA